MRVKCDKNVDMNGRIAAIRTRYDLTVGREYLVLGQLISSWDRHSDRQDLEFLLEADNGIPEWVPERLLTVVDPRLPARWEFRAVRQGTVIAVWGYHRLVFEPVHFMGIQEGDPEERYQFQKESGLAQLDFPDTSILESAAAVGGRWVQCPGCTEAWETGSIQPLLRCPSCELVLNSPFWPEKKGQAGE